MSRKWNVRIQWDASAGPIVCCASMREGGRLLSVKQSAPKAAVRDAVSLHGILYGLRRECLEVLQRSRPLGCTVWVPPGGSASGYGGLVFQEAIELQGGGGRYLLGCLIPQGSKLPEGAEVEIMSEQDNFEQALGDFLEIDPGDLTACRITDDEGRAGYDGLKGKGHSEHADDLASLALWAWLERAGPNGALSVCRGCMRVHTDTE